MIEWDAYTVEMTTDLQERVNEWADERVKNLPFDDTNPFWRMSDRQAATLLLEAMATLNMVLHLDGEEE